MTQKSPRYHIASQLDKAYLCHLQVQGSSDTFQATIAALCWDPEQPYAGIQREALCWDPERSPMLGSREKTYAGIQSNPMLGSRAALCWDPESIPIPACLSASHPDTVASKEGSDAHSDNPCGHSPRNQKRRGTPGDHGWAWGCVTSAYLLGLLPFETPAQSAHGPLAGK